ncbi:MAG: STAS domain-containing protein [Actinobacteria bacterium]|nr:STAS domain-containing protein [Actinomycetota bacterium]
MFKLHKDKKGTIVITGILSIASIEALHVELRELYDEGASATIDCSGVTEIDTAALQLLIALKRYFLETSRPIVYIAGPAMDEALALSGLKKLLLSAA